jgi:hypothetical protein
MMKVNSHYVQSENYLFLILKNLVLIFLYESIEYSDKNGLR